MDYKLSELFDLQMGKTPSRDNPAYWDSPQYAWISIADLTSAGKYITDTKESLSALAVEESGIKVIPAQTVVMSFKLSIGKVAITPVPMYSNEAIMAFVDKGIVKIDPEYLYYLLLHRDWEEGTNKAVMGKTLNKATLSNVMISIHSYEEQREIVLVLNRVSTIIDEYKLQLRTLDQLIKARFVELFGDPITNSKGFETRPGIEVFKLSNGKFVPENKRFVVGVPVYGGNGISWYTDEILCANDTVVVGRVGFQSGNVHLVEGPLWISDNAMYISDLVDDEYDLRFLYAVMDHIDFTRFQDAGDLKKITQKPFMQMQYIKPPLHMQHEYVAFVSQVDKSKLSIQASLDQLETLKQSLMQQYFTI